MYLPRDFVSRSAKWWPDKTHRAWTIFSFIFWRTKWQSISICFLHSWNTRFATMWIAAWLSQYNLIGHSKLRQQVSDPNQFTSYIRHHMTWLRIESWHHTLLLVFSWHEISLRKIQKLVVDCLSTLLNEHLKNQQLWCVYNPNIKALYQKFSLSTAASQWIVLDAERIWLKILTTNATSCLVSLGNSAYPLTDDTCQDHLRSLPIW